MEITRVKDKKSAKLFLETARIIYKNDGVWVCPPDKDIEEIFTPGKNPYFNHGEAERWILLDNGRPAGRIAAFIDRKLAYTYDQPTGGCGFFECINDTEVSRMLFDTARDWLKEGQPSKRTLNL